MVDGQVQNITDVSFFNVDDLRLNIENIDFGNKKFVFENVAYLKLSGDLAHPSTNVRMYIRNPGSAFEGQLAKSDVVFQDFLARSEITLISILVRHMFRSSNTNIIPNQDPDTSFRKPTKSLSIFAQSSENITVRSVKINESLERATACVRG